MRSVNLGSWRVAVLASLGVIQGCGGDAFSEDGSATDTARTSGTEDEGTATEGSGTQTPNGGGTTGSAGGGPGMPTPPKPGAGGGPPEQPEPVDAGSPEPESACGTDGEKDLGGGLVQCSDGVTHRSEAEMCESALPRDTVYPKSEFFRCGQDQDCTEQAHGYCEKHPPGQLGQESSSCQYGCVADSDCAEGQVCECGDPVGTCVRAVDCLTTDDCAAGSLCARYEFFNGCGTDIGYACRTEKDECMTNEECGPQMGCQWTPEGRRCGGELCAVGRPFIVAGSSRLAPAVLRGDWCVSTEVSVAPELSAQQRELVAAEWSRIALMEHASIAAFARFSLQLLSLGAPAELIEACNQAMVDETLHAKLAFGVVRNFTGRAQGPGQLSMDHALHDSDLTSIVLNTVLEGCIGETVAAVEAKQALLVAKDPAVLDVLTRIAEDERRHADLAWKFVRWAVVKDPKIAEQVQALVAAELAAPAPLVRAETDPLLAHYGIVSEAERESLRRDVLREVVAPCVDALATAARDDVATLAVVRAA